MGKIFNNCFPTNVLFFSKSKIKSAINFIRQVKISILLAYVHCSAPNLKKKSTLTKIQLTR